MCQILDKRHVVLSLLRQLIKAAAAGDVALPAGELLVDGLGMLKAHLMLGHAGVALAIDVVGHAHLDGVEGRKHVELSQGDIGETVDARGVVGDGAVEPAFFGQRHEQGAGEAADLRFGAAAEDV